MLVQVTTGSVYSCDSLTFWRLELESRSKHRRNYKISFLRSTERASACAFESSNKLLAVTIQAGLERGGGDGVAR